VFTKVLSKDAKATLALLGKAGLLSRAYLAGGTVAALQLGHRESLDLDFFTPEEFENAVVIKDLRRISQFEEWDSTYGCLAGMFNGIKLTLFLCQHKILFPFKSLYGLKVLDIREVAAMKLAAITTRTTKRDFVDFYFICKKVMPLRKVLAIYNRKYGDLKEHKLSLYKSLVYFDDVESEEMPKMLKPCDWKQVKRFFEKEVKGLIR
jgi:hypothetical protein